MTETSRPIGDDDLHAYVDDLLGDEGRSEVEKYLATNPQTAARVSAWQADTAALQRAFKPKVSEPIPDVLLLRPRMSLRRVNSWRGYAMAASVAAAFVSGSGIGWLVRGPAEPHGLTSLGYQAAIAQQVFAFDLQPLEQTKGQSMLRIGSDIRNQGRGVAAPDLRAAGYVLLGGRLVPTRQRSAALFVYRNERNQRIGVMVRLMIGIDTDAAMRSVPVEGATVYAWSRRGIGFSVVSGQPRADLKGIAYTVKERMLSES